MDIVQDVLIGLLFVAVLCMTHIASWWRRRAQEADKRVKGLLEQRTDLRLENDDLVNKLIEKEFS